MEGIVEKAREIAVRALKDDIRDNGHAFIEHPDGVAAIVRDEIGLSETSIAAVYLHEASRFHPEVDLSAFPEEVRNIVEGLTGAFPLCRQECPLRILQTAQYLPPSPLTTFDGWVET